MKKDEIRELMKDNFEEISCNEFMQNDGKGECKFYCDDGVICFKPKQKFPIKIKGNCEDIFYIGKDGSIMVDKKITFYNGYGLQVLERAIEKSKEIRCKNESD